VEQLCLTLQVTEPAYEPVHANVSVRVARRRKRHLLDSGLINRALDLVVEWGSFQVLNFNLGEQRQVPSRRESVVPDHDVMEEILSQLIDLGAVHLPQDATNWSR